ncbi:MAG: sigma-70 family RNA polymerase sigma factor [Anaerolineales bacterium]|jgi:RNA polymerase sigma-70 factor (ECF subfamily)
MGKVVVPDLSIEALRAGNRAEFARLVDATSSQIYRLALRMLGDPQDAEDILQNTYIRALRHIGEFEGRSSLSTWLYRIAVNEALMQLRKRRPEMSLSEADDDDSEDEDYIPLHLADWCCLPEQELLSSEARRKLDEAIQRLPVTLRIVFILRDLQDLSIQETGQALGISESAVKTRLLRARLRLRDELSRYYSERLGEQSE